MAHHCEPCRRVSSHHVGATAAYPFDLTITRDSGLAWYVGTRSIRRGFCNRCGSTLFFDHGPDFPTGIAAGALDDTSGLSLAVHIWTNEAEDYYTLPDDVPCLNRAQ